VDLDVVPAGGLLILRNDKAVPAAAVIADRRWAAAARSGDPEATLDLPVPSARPLRHPEATSTTFTGAGSGPSVVLLSQQFDPRWRLLVSGRPPLAPRPAFGWATGFFPGASAFRVVLEGQGARTAELAGLAVLWAAAAWMTRRPVRRG
jgi:hypothetical protein